MVNITMLIAISILFQLIEASIPLPLVVPGFKLGLANIVGLIALYLYDPKVMLEVNILRVILASLLRGLLLGTSFWLSFSGVICSTFVAILAYRYSKLSIYGVSVISSVFHAIGQVIAVTVIYQQFLMQSILPILIILAIPTGLMTAKIGNEVKRRMKVT